MSEFSQFNYIRRRGRMTPAQQRAYGSVATDIIIDAKTAAETISAYNNAMQAGNLDGKASTKVGVEIGFGMGQALVDWAQHKPNWHLFGIELYQPGIGKLCDQLDKLEIDNVAVIEQPAQEVLQVLPAHAIDEIRIFFPDPWPKKRHFSRRLIQVDFVQQLAQVIKPQGLVHLATDWQPYAQWMRECLSQHRGFNVLLDKTRSPNEKTAAQDRPETKFEQRGERLGHLITDLQYTLSKSS